MISEEQYEAWFKRATRKQRIFVNVYLKTLDPELAYKEAGYNYNNRSQGRWKQFNTLLPYIQYKMNQYDMEIGKNFIVRQLVKITIFRRPHLKNCFS